MGGLVDSTEPWELRAVEPELSQPTPAWFDLAGLGSSTASKPDDPFEGAAFTDLLDAMVDHPGRVDLSGEGWSMRIGTGPDTIERDGVSGPFYLEATLGEQTRPLDRTARTQVGSSADASAAR